MAGLPSGGAPGGPGAGASPTQMRIHGAEPRGLARTPLSAINEGRFGRMFRRLAPAPDYSDEQLQALAETMREGTPQNTGSWGQPNAQPPGGDNDAIPAAYTYFGQFVDHDITFDPASDLQRHNDPDALHDFRTPRFDLDSLYGSGPVDEPFQYDRDRPGRLLVATNDAGEPDLPRNEQQTALIGDPRNDENTIVSAIQLAFLRLHNKLADEVDADRSIPADRRFAETQRRVRWHHQWVVVRDFLPRICGRVLVDRLFDPSGERTGLPDFNLRYYRVKRNAYMPVEFSAAAFRFGHSQVRAAYELSADIRNIPLFVPRDDVQPTDDLRAGKELPGGWRVDWRFFTPPGDGVAHQPSRLIDTKLTDALFDLPRLPSGEPQSLAFRNLKRGQALRLPSGQDVARYLKADRVLTGPDLEGALEPTPLWFYVLKEAEKAADEQGATGRRLGQVGATIVAEVLLGLLRTDPLSYVNQQPDWTPSIAHADPQAGLTLGDLLRFSAT